MRKEMVSIVRSRGRVRRAIVGYGDDEECVPILVRVLRMVKVGW